MILLIVSVRIELLVSHFFNEKKKNKQNKPYKTLRRLNQAIDLLVNYFRNARPLGQQESRSTRFFSITLTLVKLTLIDIKRYRSRKRLFTFVNAVNITLDKIGD